jgi:hypothetical protein
VIAETRVELLIARQERDNGEEIGVDRRPVAALGFALVVALELAGALNRPRGDRP